jgi:tyrosine-protein kinase Etk/Wzc
VMDRIAITEASQRRLFFESQTARAKDLLEQAELAFKSAQEKYGIESIDVRALGDLRAASELRAQIMSRDIQVQSMRSFAGPENIDLKRLAAEMVILRAQLEKIERGSGSTGPVSKAALENQRAYREVKYQEALLSGLITQTELARGDEARQAPLVQQVDVARPPDRKSGPNRSSMTLTAGVWGLLLGSILAWAVPWFRRTSGERRSGQRWQGLRAAWAMRARD